jgi:hypothetical protein
MWEAFCAFHICIACLPELFRRPVGERAVRTLAVVLLPPACQGAPYIVKRAEPAVRSAPTKSFLSYRSCDRLERLVASPISFARTANHESRGHDRMLPPFARLRAVPKTALATSPTAPCGFASLHQCAAQTTAKQDEVYRALTFFG